MADVNDPRPDDSEVVLIQKILRRMRAIGLGQAAGEPPRPGDLEHSLWRKILNKLAN